MMSHTEGPLSTNSLESCVVCLFAVDAATVMGFLKHFGLDKDFKVGVVFRGLRLTYCTHCQFVFVSNISLWSAYRQFVV